MIVAKRYDEIKNSKETVQIVTNIKRMHNIYEEEKDITYIMEENNEVIGLSTAAIKDDIAILKSLIIRREYRGSDYGDGLLRAILNFIYLQKIDTVLFLYKSEYLLKKGFRYLDQNELYIEQIHCKYTSDKPMICNLERFFSKSCKH